jgi:hypothetical protein
MYCVAAGSETNNWSACESANQEVYAGIQDTLTYAKGALEANDIAILSLPLEVSLPYLPLVELLRVP